MVPSFTGPTTIIEAYMYAHICIVKSKLKCAYSLRSGGGNYTETSSPCLPFSPAKSREYFFELRRESTLSFTNAKRFEEADEVMTKKKVTGG